MTRQRRYRNVAGSSLDEQIEHDTVFSFLFDQLGIQYAGAGK